MKLLFNCDGQRSFTGGKGYSYYFDQCRDFVNTCPFECLIICDDNKSDVGFLGSKWFRGEMKLSKNLEGIVANFPVFVQELTNLPFEKKVSPKLKNSYKSPKSIHSVVVVLKKNSHNKRSWKIQKIIFE